MNYQLRQTERAVNQNTTLLLSVIPVSQNTTLLLSVIPVSQNTTLLLSVIPVSQNTTLLLSVIPVAIPWAPVNVAMSTTVSQLRSLLA